MAAGAHCLWLVRNAVSSSRTLVHADSVVVVPVQLTLWKITHVIWFPSLPFSIPFHFLFVCESQSWCVRAFCSFSFVRVLWMWWISLEDIRMTMIDSFIFSNFFFNSYRYFNQIDLNIFCVLLEIWKIEILGIEIMEKF